MKFFGVYIPSGDQAKSNDKSCVVRTLKELKEILKRNPQARFKAADSEEEALFLAQDQGSAQLVTVEEAKIDKVDDGAAKNTGRKGRLSLSALDNMMTSNFKEKNEERLKKRVVGEEKDTRFPSPRVQELYAMSSEILQRKNDAVIARVNANPRVLITDCDVPTTVQEGCRYNALHVAAKNDNKEIIVFILNLVSSYEFMKLVYPKDSDSILRDRIRHLVNGYLNTPDKMANETPLHYACKFLCVDAVEVLVSHPWCNVNAINVNKFTPAAIIGDRFDTKSIGYQEKKNKITKLLEERYIVPIWRDPLGAIQPIVGEVALVADLGDRLPHQFLTYITNLDVQALGPCKKSVYPPEKYTTGKGGVFEDVVRWEVNAVAGPTTKEKAVELFSGLKLTCGRGYQAPGSPAPVPPQLPFDRSDVPVFPEEQLSNNCQSPPLTPPRRRTEVTPPSSPFQYSPMVQRYLSIKSPVSPGPRDIMIRRQDPEKGLERIARKFALQLNIPWMESWSFLNFFGEISSEAGLSKLEAYLEKAEKAERVIAATKPSIAYSNERIEDTEKRGKNGKILGNFSGMNSFDGSFNVSRPGGDSSLDEIVNGFNKIKLNDSGYPTPRRITDCYNDDCKVPGRYCNCNGVAPSLYFRGAGNTVQHENSNDSSGSLKSYESGGFVVNESGENSLSRSPVNVGIRKQPTSAVTMNIVRLDTERREVKSMNSTVSSSPGNHDLLGLSQSTFSSDAGVLTEYPLTDDEDVEWMSAESSPQTSLEYLECKEDPIFLNGQKPSKHDWQIFSVFKEVEVEFSCTDYPLAFQWLNTMKTLGEKEMRFCDSAAVSTGRRNIRLRDLPSFASTPKRLNMSNNS